MENCKIKIIFIGTPKFGAIILEGLIKNNYKSILVITAPDKPVGRKKVLTPLEVKLVAQKYKISILQPEKVSNIKGQLSNIKPDLIICAAYGQILPKEILEIPKYGCLNIHPSLLPKYRGASPIQTAILNGDKETGITIYIMDEKMDHGKIVSSIKYPRRRTFGSLQGKKLLSDIYYEDLEKNLAELSIKLLIETIPKWVKGEIKAKPQDESKASYTKIIKKEDGKIDWSKSAQEIEQQIRAFHPWPASFTFWSKNGKNLQMKILEADILKSNQKSPIGKVILSDKKILVKCKKDFLIIKKLQIQGKKPMNSEDFLRGNSAFINAILK